MAPSDEGCDEAHCHWDSYRRHVTIQCQRIYQSKRENINLLCTRFNNLKQKNSKLKTLLSIGGWNSGSGMWSEVIFIFPHIKINIKRIIGPVQMALDPAKRKIFVDSCVHMLDRLGVKLLKKTVMKFFLGLL